MIELTIDNFNNVVAQNPAIVVKFMATWCGPCKMFTPIFKQVEAAYPNVVFASVDIDKAQGIARHFGVKSVPTVGIISNNAMIWQKSGVLNARQLSAIIDQVLGNTSFTPAYAPPPRNKF